MLLVTTATTKEMKSAFGFADAPSVEQGEVVEFELNGRKLLLAVTGVGMVNSAMYAGRLLEKHAVTGVVNLGIAGAYDIEENPLCSTCFVWKELWPEYGLLGEDGIADPEAIGFAQGHLDGEPIWNKIKLNPTNDAQIMKLSFDKNWLRASSVSVNSVTGSPTRAGWLKTACSANIENMEGFAFAYATALSGIPFLEVRTISNVVGSRFAEEWDVKGALKALGESVEILFAV